jgi:hypothetical protein
LFSRLTCFWVLKMVYSGAIFVFLSDPLHAVNNGLLAA